MHGVFQQTPDFFNFISVITEIIQPQIEKSGFEMYAGSVVQFS